MNRFTVEESNLMCIYNTGSRADLLFELAQMKNHIAADETELLALWLADKVTEVLDDEKELAEKALEIVLKNTKN